MTALQGHRTLEWQDFFLSRMAAFGLSGHQKILLARKPIRRLFLLPSRRPRYMDVIFATSEHKMARCAIDVSVRYFGFGYEVGQGPVLHRLFADPVDEARPQRLWFDPPKGSLFAEVTFSRPGKGAKIGLDGRLKLKTATDTPGINDFDEVVSSRDLTAMTMVMRDLEAAGDHARARKLLARMRCLSDEPTFHRMLASLDCSERILKYGPNFDAPDFGLSGTACFEYVETGFWDGLARLPLDKALRLEAHRLSQSLEAAGGNRVVVPKGDMWLGRLLVAVMLKQRVPGLRVDVDLAVFAEAPQSLGPWLTFEKGVSFLETEGGQVVHSLCGAGDS